MNGKSNGGLPVQGAGAAIESAGRKHLHERTPASRRPKEI